MLVLNQISNSDLKPNFGYKSRFRMSASLTKSQTFFKFVHELAHCERSAMEGGTGGNVKVVL